MISGHVHAYERSYPIHQSAVRTDGVTYIGIGDAGNKEGKDLTLYLHIFHFIFQLEIVHMSLI